MKERANMTNTEGKKQKRNSYQHEIDLTPLLIKNQSKEDFRKALENINYRGYEVEQIADGRKVIITKPGGKFVFGRLTKRDDFMVWIFTPTDNSLWLISHKDIHNDLHEKALVSPEDTIQILTALERVYNGEEPDIILSQYPLKNPCGEIPEVLLKAYKWIWGQEDINYPTGKGRLMSWEGLKDLLNSLLSNTKQK
jgi:hypothetical protein